VRRVAIPLGGAGLFLAEGAEWRRQRKLLAPTFTTSSIKVLVPHFHAAALHLLHGIEDKPEANLSKAFQDTALEAVLRALFSMPEHEARENLSALVRSYVEGVGRPNLFELYSPAATTLSALHSGNVSASSPDGSAPLLRLLLSARPTQRRQSIATCSICC